MSGLFSVADELLESLNSLGSADDDEKLSGAKKSKSPPSTTTEGAASSSDAPVSECGGDEVSTLSLLEDCLSALWQEKGGLDEKPILGSNEAVSSNSVASSLENKPSKSPENNDAPSSNGNLLMRAVEGRMQREKAKANHDRSHAQTETPKPTDSHHDNNPSLAGNAAPAVVMDRKATEANDVVEDLVGKMNHDADLIATKCFETFLQEVKDLQKHRDQLKSPADAHGLADFLFEKYIRTSLDKLPATPKVTKARTVIMSFIEKCRGPSSALASGPWKCSICSKQNEAGVATCSTCGRKRGYGGAAEKKKEVKTIQPTAPPDTKKLKERLGKKSGLERKKDLFLKQKLDYEADSRKELAGDINHLLESVVRKNIS